MRSRRRSSSNSLPRAGTRSRNQVDLLVATAEQSLAEQRAKLKTGECEEYDRRSELVTLKGELDD